MGWNGTPSYSKSSPDLGREQRDILVRLVHDSDPNVRSAAAESVSKLAVPLDASVYDLIAHDTDPRVRSALLFADVVPLEVRARLAAVLAGDSNSSVLDAFDTFVMSKAWTAESAPLDPSFIPALEARRKNSVKPFMTPNNTVAVMTLCARLARSREGLKAVAKWAVEDRSPQLEDVAVSQMRERINKIAPPPLPGRRIVQPSAVNIEIDPEDWVPMLEIERHRFDEVSSVGWVLVRLDLDLSSRFLPIAADSGRGVRMRLDALDVAANGPDPKVGELLHSILADPSWRDGGIKGPDQDLVTEIASSLSSAAGKKAIVDMLADRSIPDLLLSAATVGVTKSRDPDVEEANAILSRGLGVPWNTVVIAKALKVAARIPEQGGEYWLARAAHDAGVYSLAFDLIGEGRDPRYLSLLQDALSATISVENVARGKYQAAALNALTRYFDQRAANLILDVAGNTSSADLRDECFKALETIRKYQQEKGRWKEERISTEAWNASVNDLITLLDDKTPAVRAQAVRGLATLGAIQEMPRVVRMLKDTDESVRKAADEALGILNAPKKD
jgi:hypothetical protein